MRRRQVAIVLGLVLVTASATSGCVTKKLFRKNVDQMDTRVEDVEGAIEANERRILDLSDETDAKLAAVRGQVEQAVEVGNSAMSRADRAAALADEAARGKLLWTVTLSADRIRFGFDRATLSDEAASELDALASEVKGLGKAVYLEIEGHTDSIGSEDYNYQLGQKRAMAAMIHLNDKGGIPLHAMNVVSRGSGQPVAGNDTPEGRSKNRRVVIRVLE